MQSNSWRAMRHLLSHRSVRNRVDQYLDDDNEFVDPAIHSEAWSCGQRAIINLGLSFHSRGLLVFKDALDIVDPSAVALLVEAIEITLDLPPSYPDYESKLFQRLSTREQSTPVNDDYSYWLTHCSHSVPGTCDFCGADS